MAANSKITKDKWYRKEYQDREDELCSRREFENESDMKDGALNHRFRDYADQTPEIVLERFRSGVYPEDIFVRAELAEFVKKSTARNGVRTRAEVAAADVARREKTVKKETTRRDNRKKEYEAAQRSLDRHQAFLKQARETLEIERRLEQDT